MDDGTRLPHGTVETDVDTETRPKHSGSHVEGSGASRWTNGQCVLAVPSSSLLSPGFDLALCRTLLEREGFQVPVTDFEQPLKTALDPPSVRRYLFFNSLLFHFIMAPVLYVVVWCATFSTLHMSVTNYWLLCLSVSLVSVLITTVVILVLHQSNKEINMNTDVRLIQVNERLCCHRLLVGVADWVQPCTGNLQLFCVYWDVSSCLSTLSETLEEMSLLRDEMQVKLKKRMSHLHLVAEVMTLDPEMGSLDDEGSGEVRPLLVENEERGRSTTSNQREETKITTDCSLVPDLTLPTQAIALQLLLTYSAAYVKLLVSERLPGSSPLYDGRSHCTNASFCLCQYVKVKVLR